MTKYKSRLLSVSAAIAIAGASLSANYIPLTQNGGGDDEWVILGVSGLQSTGLLATAAGEYSAGVVPSTQANTVEDDTADEIAGVGLKLSATESLGSIKILADQTISTLEGRVDTSDVTFVETDPVRTMYIDSSGDGAANFVFTYRGSLEGKTLEYTISGGKANSVEIDSSKTFNNPAAGAIIAGQAATDGTTTSSLTETESLVDYNLTNNPPVATGWSKDNRDAKATDDTLRVYSYDAQNEKWDIFDSRNTVTSNDFTDLTMGKAYWAKMDDGNATASTKEGGLVLGRPGLTTTHYTEAGLSAGWNFIAFDGKESSIRNSVTGMVVDTTTTNTGTFKIIDSTGDNTLTITNTEVNASSAVLSRRINAAVTDGKRLGTIPGTFEMKAFPTDTAQQIILIANKKFTLVDGGAELGDASSLTGRPLYDPVDKTIDGAVADVDAVNGVMSRYGEYALVIEPLVGAGTANGLTPSLAAIDIKGKAEDLTIAIDGGAALSNVVTDITAEHDDFQTGSTGAVYEVDLSIDGTTDHVFMASKDPFYIRDNTFSRAFKVNDNKGAASKVDIKGTEYDLTVATNVADAVTDIGTAFVADDGSGNDILVVVDKATPKFEVLEYGDGDNLQFTTSSSDLAKGAVKAVYSLNYLAKLGSKNTVVFDIDEKADDIADKFRFDFSDTNGNDFNVTAFAPNPLGTSTVVTFFNELQANIESRFSDYGIKATVEHNASNADINGSVLTVSGVDILSGSYIQTVAAGAAENNVTGTATLGYLADYSADLTADLKFNAVYSSDYVMNGPLYTMKDNGFTLTALVTGTTDISDGSVAWESVDLTRDPNEWLDSQDYDLFDVSPVAGYWARLDTSDGVNPISIDDAKLSTEYSHNFDHDSGTDIYSTHNHFSGNLEVVVSGLSDTATQQFSRVTATIEGETIELVKDSDGIFKGAVSSYESYGWQYNTNTEVTINVADGLGNNFSKDYTSLDGTALFDNTTPAAPTVEVIDGELSITSPGDTSVTGFYVFDKLPPEKGTATSDNLLAHIAGVSGVASGGCEKQDASVYTDSADSIVVLAVDGDGIFGAGNVSPAQSVPFMPIMKGRALVTNTNNGTVSISTNANIFDSSCVDTGPLTGGVTGVTISAITNPSTASLAYTSLGTDINNDLPVTAYISDGAATPTIARISYPVEYGGDGAFIELAGKVYGFQFPTKANIEAGAANSGVSDTEPLPVNGQLKANIEL